MSHYDEECCCSWCNSIIYPGEERRYVFIKDEQTGYVTGCETVCCCCYDLYRL